MTLAALLLALTADLEVLSVTPSDTEVFTDQTFTVTVRVRNHGPEAAEEVKVLAATNINGLLWKIEGPPGWTCDAPGARFGYGFTCTAPRVAPESEAVFTATLAAPQPTATTYRVGAAVSAKSSDPKREGNRREVNMTLRSAAVTADLSVAARPTRDSERVTFDVRNAGPQHANEVLVVLEGAALGSGDGWKCEPSAAGVVCTRARLEAGTASAISARGAAVEKMSARVRAENNVENDKDDNLARAKP